MSTKDAPPSYQQATGSSTASSHLLVPQARNGIPSATRRSMEDEHRPLPPGWVRQWDAKEQHQFFVDTKSSPPRSIWHHPHDDEQYLKGLSSEERERIQDAEANMKVPTYTSEDEAHEPKTSANNATGTASVSGSSKSNEKPGFGRKLKDKVTGTTHEERQAQRARREEEERKYYEAHMRFRAAMQKAQMTGQPQLLGQDRDGKDVYVEPPQSMYGGGGYGSYGGGGYGYNPYSSGPYANPNARYIRPQMPYGRPYGGGYGGGMGMPLMGGLMGGMLLGGLLL